MASVFFYGNHPFIRHTDYAPNVLDTFGTYFTAPTQYLHRILTPITTNTNQLLKQTESGLEFCPKNKHSFLFSTLYITSVVLPILDAIGLCFRILAGVIGQVTRENNTFLASLKQAEIKLDEATHAAAKAHVDYQIHPAIKIPDINSPYPMEAIARQLLTFVTPLENTANLYKDKATNENAQEIKEEYKKTSEVFEGLLTRLKEETNRWTDPDLLSHQTTSWNDNLTESLGKELAFLKAKATELRQQGHFGDPQSIKDANAEDWKAIKTNNSSSLESQKKVFTIFKNLNTLFVEIREKLIQPYDEAQKAAYDKYEKLCSQKYVREL